MKTYTLIVSILFVLACSVLFKIGKDYYDLRTNNKVLNEELMKANLEIGRAQTKFAKAHTLIKELDETLQDEIRNRKGFITRIGNLEAQLLAKGQGQSVVTVTETIEVPIELKLEPYQLYQATSSNRLRLLSKLESTFTDFRLTGNIITQVENKELVSNWKYELHQRLEGQIVETILPSGAINNYIRLWELDDKNQRVNQWKLTEFEMVIEDQRQSSWHLWAPHLDIGLSGGISTTLNTRYGTSVGVSLAGKGLTPNDLDWRFLRFSLEVQDSLGLGLSLAQWNIGKPLPLVSNIWLGSTLSLTNKEKQLLLTIGSVL